MYRIRIEEIKEVVKKEKVWRKIHDGQGDDDKKPEYAYVVGEETREVNQLIFEQSVEKLNIIDVMNSINKGV